MYPAHLGGLSSLNVACEPSSSPGTSSPTNRMLFLVCQFALPPPQPSGCSFPSSGVLMGGCWELVRWKGVGWLAALLNTQPALFTRLPSIPPPFCSTSFRSQMEMEKEIQGREVLSLFVMGYGRAHNNTF